MRQRLNSEERTDGGRADEPPSTAPPPSDGIPDRARPVRASLPPVARRIAEFIAANAAEVVHMSVTELADRAGASEGSVVSLCRLLGAKGFHHLKLALARDLVQPVQFIHEDLDRGD